LAVDLSIQPDPPFTRQSFRNPLRLVVEATPCIFNDHLELILLRKF
jgi:hypothetical protein